LNQKRLNTFTIITSVLNGQHHIEKTIRSVVDQDYANFEYIIIDGKSRDNTLEIINKFADKITHIISEPDKGIYDAWNKGLKLATGDWISFIGSGDLFTSDALTRYNDYMNKNPGLDFISSKIELIDEQGKTIRLVGSKWKWDTFRRYMNTLHVGGLHHKSFFQKYGYFNNGFKIAGDYELLLRARQGLRAGFLDYPTVQVQSGGISVSDISVFDEVEKARLMHTEKPRFVICMEKNIDKTKFYVKLFLKKYLGIRYL
jgi:glycosyltransferase involved in cell wall biosynthesis